MRRLGLSAVLAVGCSTGTGDAGSTSASQTTRQESPDGEDGDEQQPDEPSPTPIDIDDSNRFVKEDLDRFLEQYPDVMREQDAELFRTCIAEQCLEHGAGKTLTPFMGAGVRYLVPLWLRGCMSGSAQACLYAGRTYQGSQYADFPNSEPVHGGWNKDELQTRFRMYIQRACKLDEQHCEQWADFTLGDESPGPRDVELAIKRLEEGCARKAQGSCEALARHADEHPKIGNAMGWWEQACELASDPTNDACSGYAERLLATGKAADRARAIEALGPTCDPGSAPWGRECKGDPDQGEERCEPTYLITNGRACVRLASTLPPADGLRLYAAMCVGSLLDEANAVGHEACEQSALLARKLRKSGAFRAAIARRTCEVDEMTCLSEQLDLDACARARQACEGSAGG